MLDVHAARLTVAVGVDQHDENTCSAQWRVGGASDAEEDLGNLKMIQIA